MVSSHNRTRILILITVFISFGITFVCSELLVRIAGHPPYKTRSFNPIHESDPKLGWKNREGKYFFPAYTQNSKERKYAIPASALNSKEQDFPTGGTLTLLAGGMRTTGGGNLDKRRKILFIGGSYSLGYGISDNETFPWKLQSRYPSVQVLNFATAGYGTYQSLLTSESLFSTKILSEPPLMILYGFIGHHEIRNVVPPDWLKSVGRRIGKEYRGVPYCTLDNEGNLLRRPVEIYQPWPLAENLAIVNYLQTQYMNLKARARNLSKREITEQLLLEMDRLSQNKDTKFAVILLSCNSETKLHYVKFLKSNDISFIDCVFPLTPERQVPLDGHPNGAMNTLWTDCIEAAIGESITKEVGSR